MDTTLIAQQTNKLIQLLKLILQMSSSLHQFNIYKYNKIFLKSQINNHIPIAIMTDKQWSYGGKKDPGRIPSLYMDRCSYSAVLVSENLHPSPEAEVLRRLQFVRDKLSRGSSSL